MLEAFCRPCRAGPLALPSRWVMPAMTRGRCRDRRFIPENIEHYRRRAAAGVGLIITEGMVVDHPLASGPGDDLPWLLPGGADGMRRLAAEVHGAGARIAAQLWHQGHHVPSGGIAARAVEKDGRVAGREARPDEHPAIIDAFARGAALARAAGFDAVEVHAAHGYLLDGFLRRYATGREDGPGARLAGSVVRKVRQEVGDGFPIILRLSQWSLDDFAAAYMRDAADVGRVVAPLVAAGVDILHVSTHRFWEPAFPGDGRTLAGQVRMAAGVPVIAVGGMGKDIDGGPDRFAGYAHADRLLAAGELDLLAVGTGLLRDPDWCAKAARGDLAAMALPPADQG